MRGLATVLFLALLLFPCSGAIAAKAGLKVLDSTPSTQGFTSKSGLSIEKPMGVVEVLSRLVENETVVRELKKDNMLAPQDARFFEVMVNVTSESCAGLRRADDFGFIVFGLGPAIAKRLIAYKVVKHRGKGISYGCAPVLENDCDGSGRFELAVHRSRIVSPRWELCSH